MEKYRIILLIHNVSGLSHDPSQAKLEYVIERKNWWGKWKEVMKTEIDTERIAHDTYSDAEAYLIAKYLGHGICQKVGVEYHYTPYSYSFC